MNIKLIEIFRFFVICFVKLEKILIINKSEILNKVRNDLISFEMNLNKPSTKRRVFKMQKIKRRKFT